MIIFESLHNSETGKRCTERGCVFPANAGEDFCWMHTWMAKDPKPFQRADPEPLDYLAPGEDWTNGMGWGGSRPRSRRKRENEQLPCSKA